MFSRAAPARSPTPPSPTPGRAGLSLLLVTAPTPPTDVATSGQSLKYHVKYATQTHLRTRLGLNTAHTTRCTHRTLEHAILAYST